MINKISLLEEENFSASNDVTAEHKKKNEGDEKEVVDPGKKAVKSKSSGKLSKAKANESTIKGATKKAASKKVSAKKIAVAADKPSTIKKVSPSKKQQAVDTKPKVLKQAKSPEILNPTSLKSSIAKITFRIKYHTVIGQSVFVSANHSLFGNDDPAKAFPLNYLNENYWQGTIEIPGNQPLDTAISYHYIVANTDGSITEEWGTDKIINYNAFNSQELLLIDSWNSSSFIENTFFTEPFQEILLKENLTIVEKIMPERVSHVFKIKAPLLSKGQAICIIGSIPRLGEWDTENPLLLSKEQGEIWHSISLDLTNAAFPFSYKYGIYDTGSQSFIQYETGNNRTLFDEAPGKLTIVSDGFAAISNNQFKGAGVAIPVFSLRSANSCGTGEFADLKLMVDWAKMVGLKLVQLLPVNDTTATHSFTDSYPYAAISAFALHPLYLHLPSIISKENQSLYTTLLDKQAELNKKTTVDYVGVMQAKWDLLKQVFPSQKELTFKSPGFNAFFNENVDWLVPYAAFSFLREQNNTADFNKWQTNQQFDEQQIHALAGSPLEADEQISIYYYVQYHLHLQLKDATNYAHQHGIIVKGDIPIGIYRNSCDAWQQPDLFYMDMQAGAPPDDFAVKGQNWGFPTYNWQKMRTDGFSWWKRRFKQMSYYFDAFRIDHILGFFRIWSIPMHAVEGILGHFVPAIPVHINEIISRGISADHDRLCKPYITDAIVKRFFDSNASMVIDQFLLNHNNENYSLLPAFNTQRKVENYFLSLEDTEQNRQLKQGLFNLVSNIILIEEEGAEGQHFHCRIAMADTPSFQALDAHTQHHLYELYIHYFFHRQDNFWMKEAMMKLPALKRSTNMLVCGEDLGMVPACVPGVMKDLAILSLEIQRMPKDPTREFFHPNDAPYLSVVTPSTHDLSTIRGWWEEDRATTQRFFNNELGQWGTAPFFCEPWINRIIILQHLYSPAMWSIFQLQDMLGISAALRRENPHEERINIPANSQHYWNYRMHIPLEVLLNESELTNELKAQIVKSGR